MATKKNKKAAKPTAKVKGTILISIIEHPNGSLEQREKIDGLKSSELLFALEAAKIHVMQQTGILRSENRIDIGTLIRGVSIKAEQLKRKK